MRLFHENTDDEYTLPYVEMEGQRWYPYPMGSGALTRAGLVLRAVDQRTCPLHGLQSSHAEPENLGVDNDTDPPDLRWKGVATPVWGGVWEPVFIVIGPPYLTEVGCDGGFHTATVALTHQDVDSRPYDAAMEDDDIVDPPTAENHTGADADIGALFEGDEDNGTLFEGDEA